MDVDFLAAVSENVLYACVSGTWLKCDEGSFTILGNKDQIEKGPVVEFYSAGVVVWADPSAVTAVSGDIPSRVWTS